MSTFGSSEPSSTHSQGHSSKDETNKEMQNFLHALRTYPDRFARQPKLTFKEHLFELAAQSRDTLRKAARAS